MSAIPDMIILPIIAFIGVCVCFVVYAIWYRLRDPLPPDAMMQILMFVGGLFLFATLGGIFQCPTGPGSGSPFFWALLIPAGLFLVLGPRLSRIMATGLVGLCILGLISEHHARQRFQAHMQARLEERQREAFNERLKPVGPIKNIAQAVEFVSKPNEGNPWGCGSGGELQVDNRLDCLFSLAKYKYQPQDAPTWKACMLDGKQNIYARLCAAYFLLDNDESARLFIREQLASQNLRHRYNAARIVQLHVDQDATKIWGIDIMIGLLADGSIDGSSATGINSSSAKDYPDGDRHDIIATPIESICWQLGGMKEKKAVPALISVLQRQPQNDGAADALGEIGDEKAIPVLLEILKAKSGSINHFDIRALGKLKAKETVSALVDRLEHAQVSEWYGTMEADQIMETLLAIGDQRAIEPIRKYLQKDVPEKSKSVARRVLVQLQSPDPVKDLLDLLAAETDKYEKYDLVDALAKYKDLRVVKQLETIARSSDSASMRYHAVLGLRNIGNQSSLLALASLLEVTFPKKMKGPWGKGDPPDFSRYFPETIAIYLRQCTQQDFGEDPTKWKEWIVGNLKPEMPAETKKTE